MIQETDLSVLLGKAQGGDRDSLDTLARQVRDKVQVYLYRMTLDYHLTEDLTHDTVLTLVKSLKQLEPGTHATLWAWVYRTALGKLQHHQRVQGQKRVDRNTVVDHEKLTQLVDRNHDSVIIKAQRREMMATISQALNNLKLTYRNVLTLRCYDQLSYAEIASVTGGSELQARLTFFRAKQALKRQLGRRGIKRDSLLTALTLFGSVTALRTKRTLATMTVGTDLVGTGATTTLIGTACSTTGILFTALLILGAGLGIPFLHSHVTTKTMDQNNVSANLTLPARIVRAHDPDGNGWQRMIPHDNGSIAWETVGFQTILQAAWHYFALAIPEGHWIEFGFTKPITDGPGYDITYHCLQSGGLGRIYLTDGWEQLVELTNPIVQPREGWDNIVVFDLADIHLAFEPNAIRIEGAGQAGSKQVFVLSNLRANN